MASLHPTKLYWHWVSRGGELKENRRGGIVRAERDEFCGICLSPYRMAHRGFQDAVGHKRNSGNFFGTKRLWKEEIKSIAIRPCTTRLDKLLVAVHLAARPIGSGEDGRRVTARDR